jgi:hypothetical protein
VRPGSVSGTRAARVDQDTNPATPHTYQIPIISNDFSKERAQQLSVDEKRFPKQLSGVTHFLLSLRLRLCHMRQTERPRKARRTGNTSHDGGTRGTRCIERTLSVTQQQHPYECRSSVEDLFPTVTGSAEDKSESARKQEHRRKASSNPAIHS